MDNKYFENISKEETEIIDQIREEMIKDISKYIFKIIEDKTADYIKFKEKELQKKYDIVKK